VEEKSKKWAKEIGLCGNRRTWQQADVGAVSLATVEGCLVVYVDAQEDIGAGWVTTAGM